MFLWISCAGRFIRRDGNGSDCAASGCKKQECEGSNCVKGKCKDKKCAGQDFKLKYNLEASTEDVVDASQIERTTKSLTFLSAYYQSIFAYNLKRKHQDFTTSNFQYLSINKSANSFLPVNFNISSISNTTANNFEISINKNITLNNSNTVIIKKTMHKSKGKRNQYSKPQIDDSIPSLKKYYRVFLHLFLVLSLVFFSYIVYTVFVKKKSLFVVKDPDLGPRKKDYFEKIRRQNKGKLPRHTIVYI